MTIVYQTTNLLNDRIYVGVHNGTNPDYLGSGNALVLAVEKYGRDNFQRETLYEGTEEECLELEEFIVDQEFVLREDTYNLTVGGGMPPVMFGNTHTKGRVIPEEERKRRSLAAMGVNKGDLNAMRREDVKEKQLKSRTENILKKTGGKYSAPSQLPEARQSVSKTAKSNIKKMFARPIVSEIQQIVEDRGLQLGRNWQRKKTEDLERLLLELMG